MISMLPDVPQDTQNWLNTSVQSFFSTCNWENRVQLPTPQEVAILEQAAAIAGFSELSFELNVQQFFAAVNWDGTDRTALSVPRIENSGEDLDDLKNDFTLTDFSDLF